ncbi:MAG: GAF domain-containing protein [Candidatus Korobacteraceae bacterium]|jgi:GAF domain-containing protein
MSTTPAVPQIVEQLDALALSASSAKVLLESVVELLHDNMLRYNWVGFYMIEELPGQEPVLVLGPYRGSMTPHTRIKLNQGICGAAASTGKTVIVDDVHRDSRYLACSLETKSEIVVPIFVAAKVVGELDIDSHFLAAFGATDRQLCEHATGLVGQFLAKHPYKLVLK